MNVLIVTAHPEPDSFNAHLAARAAGVFEKQGVHVRSVNLYSENFDPREGESFYTDRLETQKFDAMREQRHHWDRQTLASEVNRHVELIKTSDLLLLHFPFWWFGMPAILKGWMDRVFVYGGIYNSRQRHEDGVMQGKKALLTVTAGASANACAYNGRDGDMRLMLWPALHSLHYIGYSVLEPFLIYGVRGGLDGLEKVQQQQILDQKVTDFEQRLTDIASWPVIPFNKKDDFSADLTLKADAPEYSPFVRHRPNIWQADN